MGTDRRYGKLDAGYAHLGMCKLSADHKLLAYTLDKNGSEEFTLFVKDLSTGQVLNQHTTEGVVSVEWAERESCLFYTVIDNLMRPSKYNSVVCCFRILSFGYVLAIALVDI